MAKSTLSHITHLSQDLSYNFKELNDLMSKAWIHHELARKNFEEILEVYKEFAKQKKDICASSKMRNILNEFFEGEDL